MANAPSARRAAARAVAVLSHPITFGMMSAGKQPITAVFRGWSGLRYTLLIGSGARTSLTGWLARMGFADVPRAERDLAALGISSAEQPVLVALAQAADPDLALTGLAQIAERDAGLVAALTADPPFRARLTAVLGVSKFLAGHLIRHPEDSALLRGPDAARRPDAKAVRAEFLRAVGARPDDAAPVAGDPDPAALAAAYHRRILHLAARDMTDVGCVDEIAEELADLADAVLESALAIARAELPADAAPVRLAVVAMGKCGARELNYASDIDVIFVAEPVPGLDGSTATEEAALKTATRLAAGLIKACDQVTPEGSLF